MALNDNRYNALEVALVNALKADTTLFKEDGTGLVKLIHEKIRIDAVYNDSENPVIALEVIGIPDETTLNNKRFTEQVSVMIEVLVGDSDRQSNNDKLKEIIAYLRQWVRENMQNYGYGNPFLGSNLYKPVGNGPAEFSILNDGDFYFCDKCSTVLKLEIDNTYTS